MKQSVLSGSLGMISDHFVTEGYRDEITFAEKIKRLSRIPEIQGVEISFIGEETRKASVERVLRDCGLKCACVDLFIGNRRVYKMGSLSNFDPKIRLAACDECIGASDLAAETGACLINVWPGQDGSDYPLSVDYDRAYDLFMDSIIRIADHNRDVKVALEFKNREPRGRSLLDSVGTALLMAQESGRDNIGVCIDVEHVFAGNGSIGNAISMCARHERLFHIHTNDCLNTSFDAMAVGSVHFMEYLEMLHSLKKTGYRGWCSLDLSPCREDPFDVVRESAANMCFFETLLDRTDEQRLKKCMDCHDSMMVLRLMRESIMSLAVEEK